MNISPIPVYITKEDNLIDGTLCKSPQVCKNTDKNKCTKHYKNIKDKKGFHICHAGLTSYSTGIDKEPIYTAFRGEGHYDNRKIKKYKNDYLPTIPKDLILTSVYKVSSGFHASIKLEEDKEMMNSTLHEIRTLNSQIKRFSESIIKDGENAHKLASSIFASSTLMSARLSAYDLENNPQLLLSGSKFNTGFYEKFTKASHCLETLAKDNNVRISSFVGNSYMRKDVYHIFDFLPYVILENAIKYSPKNQEITVTFTEFKNETEVIVSSLGPVVTKDELKHIFNKGYRGSNAAKANATGGGFGLYFARLICDLNEIEIKAYSGDRKLTMNSVDYSDFEITLRMIS